tara:strand:+ start:246 stop:542 length:297 start_codon:yes stop_codon:yes gene_type:complete
MSENAKEELLNHIEGRTVELIRIVHTQGYWMKGAVKIEGSLESVSERLDFEYDDGFGAQYIYGYIWYTDGTWSERREYDGSEWWQHQARPDKDVIIGE